MKNNSVLRINIIEHRYISITIQVYLHSYEEY